MVNRHHKQRVCKETCWDTSTPVLVFDSDDRLSLGIARSLGRLGITIYGLNREPKNPCINSKYYKKMFFLPKNRYEKNELLTYLTKIGEEIGKKALLLCTTDQNVSLIAKYSEELEKYFYFHRLPYDFIQSIISKKQMYNLAKEYGISSPLTFFLSSRKILEEHIRELNFPVVLKPNESKNEINGKKFFLTKTRADLLDFYNRHEAALNGNYIVQEYFASPHSTFWMFDGYFNNESQCLFGSTGFKVRQSPFDGGATSLGACLNNEELASLSKQLMKNLKYKGIVDIDFVFDRTDHTYKILDMNPRIGATFRLFTGTNGLDVVRAEYLDLTGQTVEQSYVSDGRKWFLENFDFFSSASGYLRGALTASQWLKSLNGVQEAAWFAIDDLFPFFAMSNSQVKKIIKERWWIGMFGHQKALAAN